MDTFTFLTAILLMIIGLTYNQNWVVFAVIAVMVLTSRNITTLILMGAGGGILFFIASSGADLNALWPLVVFGLIIISLVIGIGKQEKQPEYFGPEMGGGYFGGQGGGY
jgi:hypothetical protein